MTEEIFVTPLIHVIIGEGLEARTEDVDFADIALEGDDPGTISDSDLLARLERHLDLEAGALADRKVTRPETGNIVVGARNVYGEP